MSCGTKQTKHLVYPDTDYPWLYIRGDLLDRQLTCIDELIQVLMIIAGQFKPLFDVYLFIYHKPAGPKCRLGLKRLPISGSTYVL